MFRFAIIFLPLVVLVRLQGESTGANVCKKNSECFEHADCHEGGTCVMISRICNVDGIPYDCNLEDTGFCICNQCLERKHCSTNVDCPSGSCATFSEDNGSCDCESCFYNRNMAQCTSDAQCESLSGACLNRGDGFLCYCLAAIQFNRFCQEPCKDSSVCHGLQCVKQKKCNCKK